MISWQYLQNHMFFGDSKVMISWISADLKDKFFAYKQ